MRALRSVLRAVGASDGNMDEVWMPSHASQAIFELLPQGSLRCDINVSVNREGESLGTRCEVKNINSVRFLMSAIRQFRMLPPILS